MENKVMKCVGGCQGYNKSMDEVVEALAKHRDAAIALKEINQKQRVKLNEYRDERMKMQDLIDQLELEKDLEKEFIWRKCTENKELENKVKLLNEDLRTKIERIEILVSNDERKSDEIPVKDEAAKLETHLSSNVIKELKNKLVFLDRKLADQSETIRNLKVTSKEEEETHKHESVAKACEYSELKSCNDELKQIINDQRDELEVKEGKISEMKIKLENKEESIKGKSCHSIADELDQANVHMNWIKQMYTLKKKSWSRKL
jgi:chromosome segregation ATPase